MCQANMKRYTEARINTRDHLLIGVPFRYWQHNLKEEKKEQKARKRKKKKKKTETNNLKQTVATTQRMDHESHHTASAAAGSNVAKDSSPRVRERAGRRTIDVMI